MGAPWSPEDFLDRLQGAFDAMANGERSRNLTFIYLHGLGFRRDQAHEILRYWDDCIHAGKIPTRWGV